MRFVQILIIFPRLKAREIIRIWAKRSWNYSLISLVTICLHILILSKRGFRKAQLNINSQTKHIDELRILLFDYSIDIISINETKLDDTIKSCEVHIPGYEFIRRDRNRQGGGVDFYIKTSINFVVCSNLIMIAAERPKGASSNIIGI